MFRTALISMFLTSTALATTWTVDDDGKADFDNIQDAVDAANDGDEIIVMPGTYTSTALVVVDMLGKAVWLRSSGGAGVTIIDGEETRMGLHCRDAETSNTQIEGFTLTNGLATSLGGGMSNTNSSPTVINCTFTNNYSNHGGGMYNNDNSSPTLTNCTFIDNEADFNGGGMFSTKSNPTLTDCTFTNNTAGTDGGGGMYNNSGSNPTLTNCSFTGNTASDSGGGMYNNWSSPTVTDCTFTGNTATGDWGGGGMYNINSSSPTLTNCTFTSNFAKADGGGMRNEMFSSSTLTNCTLCSNAPNQISGTWSDEGGNTVAAICPVPGACCTNDNCLVSEQENCLAFFGEWYGEGTTCKDNPCPTSCLGDVTGDGQVDVSDLLVIIAVWGACP